MSFLTTSADKCQLLLSKCVFSVVQDTYLGREAHAGEKEAVGVAIDGTYERRRGIARIPKRIDLLVFWTDKFVTIKVFRKFARQVVD